MVAIFFSTGFYNFALKFRQKMRRLYQTFFVILSLLPPKMGKRAQSMIPRPGPKKYQKGRKSKTHGKVSSRANWVRRKR